jgi:zinc protease
MMPAVEGILLRRSPPDAPLRMTWSPTMTKIILILIFMTTQIIAQDTLDRSKPPVAKPPKDVSFPSYFDTTASNGINVLVIENHKIPSVSIRLVFKNGGSFYDGEKPGVSSLTAELLTKGTKNRTATQIAEEIDFLGASLSSGSDWDGSYVTLTVLKKHLDKAMDVLADVVLNPVFDEEEVKRIKEQRISSIIQGKDDAGTLSDRMFNKVVFDRYPYGFPSEGTEQSVATLTKSDFEEFYRKHFCPRNLILAFVGAINKEEALKIVEDRFSSWRGKCENHTEGGLSESSSYSTKEVYIVDKPGAVQSNLKIGHIGIERNNPDFIAVTVMNAILGGYFGSRLNLILREQYGYTYGIRSSFSARIHPGDFSVDSDVRNEVTDSAVKLIIGELKRISSEYVSDDELQTVKNYLTGIFPLQLETANAVATRAIYLKLYDLPKDYYNTFISNVNQLTKDDILNTAKKYIHPENLYIVLSGNSNVIREKMQKFGKVKVYDAEGKEVN